MENSDVRPGYIVVCRDELGRVEHEGRVMRIVDLFGRAWISYGVNGRSYYALRDDPKLSYLAPAVD